MLIWFMGEVIAQPKLPLHTIAVFGNVSLGYYYATLYIGTPLKPQTFIVDTGSSELLLPCTECKSCGNKHLNQFVNTNSSTFKFLNCKETNYTCECSDVHHANSCSFQISYIEGSSYQGVYFEDRIVLGDSLYKLVDNLQKSQQQQKSLDDEAVFSNVGCVLKETNYFFSQEANGIFGLGPQQKSKLLQLTAKLHSNFTGERLAFSLCFGFNGGIMSIGGTQSKFKSQSPVVAKFDRNKNLYLLNSKFFKIDGKAVFKLWGIRTFVDSGTTYTFLQTDVFKIVAGKVDQVCTKIAGCRPTKINDLNCFTFQHDNLTAQKLLQLTKTFPTFGIQIEEGDLEMKPINYMIPSGKDSICLGVYSYNENILGTTFMRHKNIVFDRQKETVAFHQSNCGQDLQQEFIRQTHSASGSSVDRQPNQFFIPMQTTTVLLLAGLGVLGVVLACWLFRRKCAEQNNVQQHIQLTSQQGG